MIINLNKIKNVRFKFHEWFWIKIPLQLMSIFGFDNNCETISVCPFFVAKINGVSLNEWFKFQKWL